MRAVLLHSSPNGILAVNGNRPAVGREAIAAVAQSFMTAFPDLRVVMDDLRTENGELAYHWTLTGTNTGPGGDGKSVRISGYEQWEISPDGLIAESRGHFDFEDYMRQLS
jgi:predicted ester cyclase